MDKFTVIKDVTIAIAAFVGAGLGVFNYLRENKKDKVILKVTPKSMMSFGLNDQGKEVVLSSDSRIDAGVLSEYFSIDIINLSSFSIEVSSVGMLVKGTKERMGIIDPTRLTGDTWPKRLEPREAVTVHAFLDEVLQSPNLPKVECVYAETTCGHLEKGSSEAFSLLLTSKNA